MNRELAKIRAKEIIEEINYREHEGTHILKTFLDGRERHKIFKNLPHLYENVDIHIWQNDAGDDCVAIYRNSEELWWHYVSEAERMLTDFLDAYC